MPNGTCVWALVGFSTLIADLSFLPLLLPIEAATGVRSAFLASTYTFSLLGDLFSLLPDCFGSLKAET